MGHILATGIGVFIAVLVLQVVLWRLLDVRRELLGLAVIYLVLPFCLAGYLAVAGVVDLLDLVLIALLYLALASGYIQTYPALREDIPSFRILFAIHAAGEGGITESGIVAALQGNDLLTKKMDDLERDRMVGVDAQGKLKLLPAGMALALIFRAYRRLLGLRRGLG